MSVGSLGVVEQWLAAVNRGDQELVEELSAEDVEIVGPRGSARGRNVLADWLGRAGFSADALRWYCGDDGRVVAQEARWVDPDSGAELGRARVASCFIVSAGAVAYYQRHETVGRALAAAGLDADAEVTSRVR
jgi:SnoaL-like domain